MRAGLWLIAAISLNVAVWRHAFNGMDRNDNPGDTMLGPLQNRSATLCDGRLLLYPRYLFRFDRFVGLNTASSADPSGGR